MSAKNKKVYLCAYLFPKNEKWIPLQNLGLKFFQK